MIGVETNHSNPDRVLVLETIDDKKPKSSMGLVDPQLFIGKNRLHCIKDPQTCHWYFKYDQGILPQPLKDRFTSFKAAMRHAELYFRNRNLRIKEVID